MNAATTRIVALASVGSATLLILCFKQALEGAGPYKGLPGLKSSLAIGLGISNLFVLALIGMAAVWVGRLSNPVGRRMAFLSLATFAAIVTLAAPLLPSAALAGLCIRQWLCPDIANPLLWAYLQGFTSLPVAPLVVAPLVATSMYVYTKRSAATNGA